DVALEEPAHRMRRGQVGGDLDEGALLRAGRPEGEPCAQRGDEPRRRGEGRAGLPTDRAPAGRKTELQEEQLVEDERTVRERARLRERLDVSLGRRRVHVAERTRE